MFSPDAPDHPERLLTQTLPPSPCPAPGRQRAATAAGTCWDPDPLCAHRFLSLVPPCDTWGDPHAPPPPVCAPQDLHVHLLDGQTRCSPQTPKHPCSPGTAAQGGCEAQPGQPQGPWARRDVGRAELRRTSLGLSQAAAFPPQHPVRIQLPVLFQALGAGGQGTTWPIAPLTRLMCRPHLLPSLRDLRHGPGGPHLHP